MPFEWIVAIRYLREGRAQSLLILAGVAVGTAAWYLGLGWVVSLGHGKLSEKTLLRMEHYSGACLLILALIEGGLIIGQMHSKH